MSKKLIIKVCDPDFIEPFEFRDSYFFDENYRIIMPKGTDYTHPCLDQLDCPNVLHKVGYTPHSKFINALDVVIAQFAKTHINTMEIDISEREQKLSPVKEMTIGEIEEKLGYRIKVVKEDTNK